MSEKISKQKFKVELVRDYIYKIVVVKGKEIKKDINQKVLYPFDK